MATNNIDTKNLERAINMQTKSIDNLTKMLDKLVNTIKGQNTFEKFISELQKINTK